MTEGTTREVLREVFTRHRRKYLARGVPKAALSEERIRRLARRTMPRFRRGGRRRLWHQLQTITAAIKRYFRWHLQRV